MSDEDTSEQSDTDDAQPDSEEADDQASEQSWEPPAIEHPLEAGPGEYLVLTDKAWKEMKGKTRHVFEPDDNGGYSARCGNKRSPKHISGKHLVVRDKYEVLLDSRKLCTSCKKAANLDLAHLDLDRLRDFARNGYDSTYVVEAGEVEGKLREDRIPVRMSAELEIDLPASTESKLLEILSRAPHLLDRIQGIDAGKDEIIVKSVETVESED